MAKTARKKTEVSEKHSAEAGVVGKNNPDGLDVETWPIDRVVPYDQNPRVCPESAVRKVAGSIKAYGWRQPIVVDAAGVIIAGHTRHKAARLLGLAEVPVHVARGMTEAQIRAYRIADNRVAEETDWDKDLLTLELEGLAMADGVWMEPLGFNEDELRALLTTVAPTLEQLEQQHGTDVDEAGFHPVIKVRVTPETKRLYDELLEVAQGDSDGEQFASILEAARGGFGL